jgi:hypothetical protein
MWRKRIPAEALSTTFLGAEFLVRSAMHVPAPDHHTTPQTGTALGYPVADPFASPSAIARMHPSHALFDESVDRAKCPQHSYEKEHHWKQADNHWPCDGDDDQGGFVLSSVIHNESGHGASKPLKPIGPSGAAEEGDDDPRDVDCNDEPYHAR